MQFRIARYQKSRTSPDNSTTANSASRTEKKTAAGTMRKKIYYRKSYKPHTLESGHLYKACLIDSPFIIIKALATKWIEKCERLRGWKTWPGKIEKYQMFKCITGVSFYFFPSAWWLCGKCHYHLLPFPLTKKSHFWMYNWQKQNCH